MCGYVYEYARDKIMKIHYNNLIKPEHKGRMIEEIQRITGLYDQGVITTDEAMLLIAKV